MSHLFSHLFTFAAGFLFYRTVQDRLERINDYKPTALACIVCLLFALTIHFA